MELTKDAARSLRDVGIDAIAALDVALSKVLKELDQAQHAEFKNAIGRAITAVINETITPAIKAYPVLEPDQATWGEVVGRQAAKRATFG